MSRRQGAKDTPSEGHEGEKGEGVAECKEWCDTHYDRPCNCEEGKPDDRYDKYYATVEAAKEDDGTWDLPPGWTEQSARDFWKNMGGSLTKCVEQLEDDEDIKDAEKFCSTLADRVEGDSWQHEPRDASTEDLLDFVYDTGRLLTTGNLNNSDFDDFSNSLCVAMTELEVRGAAEFGEQALEEAGLL